MADKNIKKETKKPKKSDKKPTSGAPAALRTVAPQPELIKKEKKFK